MSSSKDWTVWTLIATTHLTNVQNKSVKGIKYGFIESLGCVIIINFDWQISSHVGYGKPSFDCKVDTCWHYLQLEE